MQCVLLLVRHAFERVSREAPALTMWVRAPCMVRLSTAMRFMPECGPFSHDAMKRTDVVDGIEEGMAVAGTNLQKPAAVCTGRHFMKWMCYFRYAGPTPGEFVTTLQQ